MQIQDLAAKLEPLGLTDKEARVYVAALFLGPSSVQKIASQAEINRATAYVILDQLAAFGLISQSQEGKKTVFVAEPPEALDRLFEQQKNAIEDRRTHLKTILPELEQTHRSADDSAAPVVRFYKGSEGANAASAERRRKARPGEKLYGMANYDEVEKIFPDIFKTSTKTRAKKHLSTKVIYSYKREIPTDESILRETYRVNEPVKADISLYEKSASFWTYAGKKSVGVVIESPEIVGALRQLFELAWKNRPKQE